MEPIPANLQVYLRRGNLKNPRGLNILEISAKTGINRMSVAKYLDVRTVGSAKIYHLSRRIPLTAFLKHTFRYYLVIDENMGVIQINEKIVPVVRVARKQTIGKHIRDVAGKQDVNYEECETAFAKAPDGEETSLEIEYRFEGRVGYYKVINTPIEFSDGTHDVLITSDDITEKKAMEAALKVAGEKYRNLVEKIPDIVLSAGADGMLDYTGPQLARYGFVPEELAGHPVDRLMDPRERDAAMPRLLAAAKVR